MRIAFYAPMKPPDDPNPSGDRAMARALWAALIAAGHDVQLVSRFRSRSTDPDAKVRERLAGDGAAEAARLIGAWNDPAGWRPDLWWTYHLYYKAPDWLGPPICRQLAIPYITAEASYASKRDRDAWAPWQAVVADAIRAAAVNVCFTAQDREGVARVGGRTGTIADLPPFLGLGVEPGSEQRSSPTPHTSWGVGGVRGDRLHRHHDAAPHPRPDLAIGPAPSPRKHGERGEVAAPTTLVTVAMMRPGVKIDSYVFLAAALQRIADLPWRLTIVGDGSARADVAAAFAPLSTERITWAGACDTVEVNRHLAAGDVYVWPGFGEAFGVAYLEAQAHGLPVVAQRTGGIPSVVEDGRTGLLTPPGDVEAYAAALTRLLADADLRARMSAEARRFVHDERSLAPTAARLNAIHAIARRSPT